ncbi:MAG TPA: hypothetical protein VJ505_15075 [Holophagaceae bacterium]|nr:hypothetical protein [Holophagaceae bacterium]
MGTFKNVIRKIRRLGLDGLYQRVDAIPKLLGGQRNDWETVKVQLGDLQSRQVRALPDKAPLRDAEFKVFSQFGDDGIFQYLFSRIPAVDSFVEFGVEDYTEANTRFLLMHDNWRGLILDGRPDLQAVLDRQGLPFLHDLTVRSAFITAENINQLLTEAGFTGEIGLLSVDIDGNDYWVWKAIDVVRPQVVVVEYNAVLGAERALTVPYDPAFMRSKAHPSWLYWGASLPAYCQLAEEKGYAFVGCNHAGINAYFVRKDLCGPFRVLTPKEGFVLSRFRDSRDAQGRMSKLGGQDRLKAIATCPMVDVASGKTVLLQELLG